MAAPSSSSSSSSPSSTPTHAIIDSTYTSLYSLLSAPASSSKHLSLLPPNALYSSITHYLARLRQATLPDFVKVVATSRSLWNAPSIIQEGGEERIHEDVAQLPTSNEPSAGGGVEPSLASRSYHLQLSAARACFAHIELLLTTSKGSVGWGTQRKLRHWVNQINSSLVEASSAGGIETSATTAATSLTPMMHGVDVPRLSILTGLVVGLSAYRQQNKDKDARLSVRLALRAAESYWLEAFAHAMQALMDINSPPIEQAAAATSPESEWELEFKKSSNVAGNDLAASARRSSLTREAALVPLLLAGQVSPLLSEATLSSLPLPLFEGILHLIPLSILPLFSHRANLRLSSTPGELRNPTTHALFSCLGPLSRLMASAAEVAVLKMRGDDVQRLLLSTEEMSVGALRQLVEVAEQLDRDFASGGYLATCPSSDAAALADTWKSLKAFLFITVQLFDSVLDALVTTLPSPVTTLVDPAIWVAQWAHDRKAGDNVGAAAPAKATTNIPRHVLDILKLQVMGLMRLSFVTFSTTSGAGDGQASERPLTSNDIYNRFTTYRHAFYGSLEVIRSDWAASTTLYEELLQASTGTRNRVSEKASPSWVVRSRLVVLLDSAEQLLPSLPSSLISESLLPLCRPHLLLEASGNADADLATFESAHACLLALFEAKRPERLVKDVMPYYVEALLQGHAKGQISGSASGEEGEESEEQSAGPGQLSHALSTVVACMSDVDDARCYWVVGRLEEEVRARDGEKRLDVQLVLVDLLPTVNLVLLRSVLGTVRSYILEEKEKAGTTANVAATTEGEASTESEVDEKGKTKAIEEDSASLPVTSLAHRLLCSRTFAALNSMDDTARQEGVRWWLDHRREFGV